jgi:selenocysteine-specific elongation factor
MTLVVGTAGHIDHGKTSLLRALTGIDADRLPEERRRGMTIDVGYAWLRLDDGREIDFVDVPGHDRLVANMLVGAGEIDAALLVVAADDGPRAQTIEHLELLDALGIERGIAVVSKADAVDPQRIATVRDATAALLAGTSLRGVPVLTTSAETGAGIDQLRAALAALAEPRTDERVPGLPSRLAIDRAFTVRGRGLVVTGTLRGSGIARADVLRLVPGGRDVRVREVQVHGETVEHAPPGRTALAIAGVELADVERGMVITSDPDVVVADRLLVALEGAAAGRLQLHEHTAQVGATVSRAAGDRVPLADGRLAAVLRLDRPIATAPGDRFVLRRPSPARTETGGRVLDARPPRGPSRRRVTPERVSALATAVAGDSAARDAARLDLHGSIGDRVAPDVGAAISARAIGLVAAAPDGVPLAELRTTLARELRHLVAIDLRGATSAVTQIVDQLTAARRLLREHDRVRDPGVARPAHDAGLLGAMTRLERVLDVPAPPALDEAMRVARCSAECIRALERDGRIVRLDGSLAWSTTAFARLEQTALDLAGRAPLTPAALRDATGTSRKYVMAILEDLDRRGVLRRTPAGHVPGPRARTGSA